VLVLRHFEDLSDAEAAAGFWTSTAPASTCRPAARACTARGQPRSRPGGRGGPALLAGGWPALAEYTTAARRAAKSGAKRRALDELEGYFYGQREHLGYAGRLAGGQSIGSGLVEGSCKQVIGWRMERTGARRRVRRAKRMATLYCAQHGDTWADYWANRLNRLPESAHAPRARSRPVLAVRGTARPVK
jgi:hypothetical protein